MIRVTVQCSDQIVSESAVSPPPPRRASTRRIPNVHCSTNRQCTGQSSPRAHDATTRGVRGPLPCCSRTWLHCEKKHMHLRSREDVRSATFSSSSVQKQKYYPYQCRSRKTPIRNVSYTYALLYCVCMRYCTNKIYLCIKALKIIQIQ